MAENAEFQRGTIQSKTPIIFVCKGFFTVTQKYQRLLQKHELPIDKTKKYCSIISTQKKKVSAFLKKVCFKACFRSRVIKP